jgi:hypothetical protein
MIGHALDLAVERLPAALAGMLPRPSASRPPGTGAGQRGPRRGMTEVLPPRPSGHLVARPGPGGARRRRSGAGVGPEWGPGGARGRPEWG